MEIVEFFFPPGSGGFVARVVNVIILAMGVTGLIELWRARRSVARDRDALAQFREKAKAHLAEPIDFGPGKPTPAPGMVDTPRSRAERLEASAARLDAGSQIRQRMDALHDLRLCQADPDAATLSAQVVAQFERHTATARWTAGGVVLVGLAGTLVGLSVAVAGAQGLVGEVLLGDADVLRQLTATFGGLTTAFSTTLAGMVVAVLLGVFLAHVRARQTKFLESLERFSLTHVYPCYRTSPSLALAQSAIHLSRIEEGLEDALKEVVATMRTTGEALVRTTTDKLVNLTSTIDRSFTELRTEVAQGSAHLLQSYEQTHNRLSALAGDPTGSGVTLSSVAERLDQAGAEFVMLSSGITQTVPSIEEAIARQVDRQSRDLHETMHAYVDRHSSNIAAQNELIGTGLATLGTRLPEFERTVVAALAGHEKALVQSLGGTMTRLAEAMEQANHASLALQKAAGILDGTTDRIEVVLQRAVSASSGAAGGADRIVAAIHELHQSLNGSRQTPLGPLTGPGVNTHTAVPNRPPPGDSNGSQPPTSDAPEAVESMLANLKKKMFG